MKLRFLPVVLILVIASCATQEVCDDESQSILVARFKTTKTGELRDTILPGISIYGIREGKSDSLLYNSSDVARIELPLDPGSDHSRFVLSTGEKTDTLLVMHHSEAYLISYNCGFAARFTLVGYGHAGGMIVDIEMIKASVDAELESNEEHLWIYF
jgi:hypothetical protein